MEGDGGDEEMDEIFFLISPLSLLTIKVKNFSSPHVSVCVCVCVFVCKRSCVPHVRLGKKRELACLAVVVVIAITQHWTE